MDRLSPFNLS